MAFRSETTNTFVGARLGQSRLFIRGGRFRRLLPGESYSYLGRTDITPPQITRGDKTTFEMPSDTDGNTTVLIEAAPGSYETNTGTITQRLEATMGEGWWDAIRDNAPVTMWIPVGRVRQLDDINDWEGGWLIDRVYLKNFGPDNNANPSDRATTGEPFNLTGEFEYESYAVHRFQPVRMSAQSSGTHNSVSSVGFRDGADGINLVAGVAATPAQGTAVTAAAGKLLATDVYGDWATALDLSEAAHSVDDLVVLGSSVLAVDSVNEAHHTIRIDDILTGTSTGLNTVTAGYVDGNGPSAVYARSAGNILMAGLGGYIYRASSLLGSVETVDAGSTTDENLNDIHGLGEQVVAVGDDGTIVVSEDFGASWVKAVAEVDGTALGDTVNCKSVHMVEKDTFLVAVVPDAVAPATPVVVYYTRDFGRSLIATTIIGFTPTDIGDIQFVLNETGVSAIGYLAASNATAGGVGRSLDGGLTWNFNEPYVPNIATNVGMASIVPIDANRVISGGTLTAEDLTSGNEAAAVGVILASAQV